MRGAKAGIGGAILPSIVVAVGLFYFECGWAAILLYHALIVVALLRARYGFVGLPRVGKDLLKIAPFLIIAVLLLGKAAPPELGRFLDRVLAALHLSGAWWLLFIPYFALVNPLLEELYWRGLLGETSATPTWGDAAFALYHMIVLYKMYLIGWPWRAGYFCILAAIAFSALMYAAWMWRKMAAAHGNLRLPIVSHAAADICIVLLAHLLRA